MSSSSSFPRADRAALSAGRAAQRDFTYIAGPSEIPDPPDHPDHPTTQTTPTNKTTQDTQFT